MNGRKRGRPRKNPIVEETQTMSTQEPESPDTSTTVESGGNWEPASPVFAPPQDFEARTSTVLPSPPGSVDNRTAPPRATALHVDEVAQIMMMQAQRGEAPTDVDDFDDILTEPGANPPGWPEFIEWEGRKIKPMPCVVGPDDIKGSRHRYMREVKRQVMFPVTKDMPQFRSIPRDRFDPYGFLQQLGDRIYFIDAKVKEKIDNERKARGAVAQLSRAMVGTPGVASSIGEDGLATMDQKFKEHKHVGVPTPVGARTGA